MIEMCVQIEKPEFPPFAQFMVCTSSEETAETILRLCGKIPKLNHRREHDGREWECVEVVSTRAPDSLRPIWTVSCIYRPIADLSDAEPEEHFPPYHGPRGKQPDGSFVLTPRCYKKLIEAAEWRGRTGMGCVMPTSMCEQEFVKLVNLIHEDCGIEFGILS